MKARLHNTLFLSVTLFFFSCSMGSKIDQSVEEMRNMNKNMEEMNKNLATELARTNDSFSKLVESMKPEQWIDQIADRFQETLSQFSEQTLAQFSGSMGDVKKLVENGNAVSTELLKFMNSFSADELKALASSIREATTYMKGVNDFMTQHSDDVDVLLDQTSKAIQMSILLGAGAGIIDVSDPEALIKSVSSAHETEDTENMDDKMASLDIMASAEGTSGKALDLLTKERLQYAADHSMAKYAEQMNPLIEFATLMNTEAKEAGTLKKYLTDIGTDVGDNVMSKFWTEKKSNGEPVSFNQYLACMFLKTITDFFVLQGSASNTSDGNIVIGGEVKSNSRLMPNGNVDIKASGLNVLLKMSLEERKKIYNDYNQYCKDVKTFQLTKPSE